jgi:hypothetical protein
MGITGRTQRYKRFRSLAVRLRHDAVDRGLVRYTTIPHCAPFLSTIAGLKRRRVVVSPPGLTSTNPSCIHSYLFLRALPNVIIRACSHCSQPRSCPNCKYAVPPPDIPRWRTSRNQSFALRKNISDQFEPNANGRTVPSHGGNVGSNHESRQPFMANFQSEEAAARESSEFQTSGHNTPRCSAETLESESIGFSGGVDERGVGSLV